MSWMLDAPAPSFYSQYAQPLVPKIQQSSIHKPHFLDFKQASPTVLYPLLPTVITPTDCCRNCFPVAALNHQSAHTEFA